MKARGFLAVLGCAAAAVPALPAAAAAQPDYVVKGKSLRLSVPLPAAGGYTASLDTEGHRRVTLTVERGSFSASYTALGRVSRKGVEADFGALGHVSLRFRGKSRIPRDGSRPRPECKGRMPVRERGIFHGNVRFAGERGYTEVRGSRLGGTVTRTYKQICKRSPRAQASAEIRLETAILAARAAGAGETRLITLIEVSLPEGEEITGQVLLGIAQQERKVGRVAVSKLLFLLMVDGYDALEISPRGAGPLVAEVRMPKPFAGTGTYLEEGDLPPTWTGEFGARLPGSGLVPLAGPEFEVVLCQASSPRGVSACTEELRPLTAQGSGSHSQPLALARLSSLR
jgi:hypothetical protein